MSDISILAQQVIISISNFRFIRFYPDEKITKVFSVDIADLSTTGEIFQIFFAFVIYITEQIDIYWQDKKNYEHNNYKFDINWQRYFCLILKIYCAGYEGKNYRLLSIFYGMTFVGILFGNTKSFPSKFKRMRDNNMEKLRD